MNYYEVLGVPTDATKAQIRAAYRQKSKDWHPDRNSDPNAAEKMQEINAAYEVLKDPVKRKVYDDSGYTSTVDPKLQAIENEFNSTLMNCLNESNFAEVDYTREVRISLERKVTKLSKDLKIVQDRMRKLTKLIDTHEGKECKSFFTRLSNLGEDEETLLEWQIDIVYGALGIIEEQVYTGKASDVSTTYSSNQHVEFYITPGRPSNG